MSEDKLNNKAIKRARRRSQLRYTFKIMFGRPVVAGGVIVILILIAMALFAPLIAPYDPLETDLLNTLQQPSMKHLLGTDELGRDVLSRIIYGSQTSLIVGVVSVIVAGAIGTVLGLIAGYFGGWVNAIIMRITDALLSFPPLILMLGIAAVLGRGIESILIAVAVGMIPTYTRLICGQVLSVKEADYVTAAFVTGTGNIGIMYRHVLPNSFAPMLVLMTINLGGAILAEAGLSFLGIGITPPTPTWGNMVNVGYRYLISNPLLSFSPGIAILLVVLAFNMVGDGLRDALDPRLKGTL